MGRKVITFSLPEGEEAKLQTLLRQTHLSRSQFLRQLLDSYQGIARATKGPIEGDLSQILRTFWDVKSQAGAKVTIIGLGIVRNNLGEVLIVSRPSDATVEQLSWSFPGGSFNSLEFSDQLQLHLEERTGLSTKIGGLVSARIIPDASLKTEQIIALYFDCGSAESKVTLNGHYTDYKWVKPLDVFRHFTTSTSDEVTKYLSSLHYLD